MMGTTSEASTYQKIELDSQSETANLRRSDCVLDPDRKLIWIISKKYCIVLGSKHTPVKIFMQIHFLLCK